MPTGHHCVACVKSETEGLFLSLSCLQPILHVLKQLLKTERLKMTDPKKSPPMLPSGGLFSGAGP
jgi:hypothetical protein